MRLRCGDVVTVAARRTLGVVASIDSLLLNAVPFAESHRLVELHTRGPYGSAPRQPACMVEHWQSETTLFERVEPYARLERVFIGDREPETLKGARIAPGLLRLLGVGPRLGRAFAADESASAVGIISHATWQTRFGGDAGIVGRTLRFTDRGGRSATAGRLRPGAARARRVVRAGRRAGRGARSAVECRVDRDRPDHPARTPERACGTRVRRGSLVGAPTAGRPLPAVRRGRLRAADRVRQRREPVPLPRVVPTARARDTRRRRGRPAPTVPSVVHRVDSDLLPRGAARSGACRLGDPSCRDSRSTGSRPGVAEPDRRRCPCRVLGVALARARRRIVGPAENARRTSNPDCRRAVRGAEAPPPLPRAGRRRMARRPEWSSRRGRAGALLRVHCRSARFGTDQPAPEMEGPRSISPSRFPRTVRHSAPQGRGGTGRPPSRRPGRHRAATLAERLWPSRLQSEGACGCRGEPAHEQATGSPWSASP